MKREPTAEEREKIDRAIIDGDRIEATSMYISITECGLTEAQQFIKARTVELQTEHPEKVRKETPLEMGPRRLLFLHISRRVKIAYVFIKQLLYNLIS